MDNKFYSKYVSAHSGHLYGKLTADDIRAQFPVWDAYFGKFLPTNKNGKLLDAGAGNGGFVLYLQSRGYANAGGVDISEEQVDLAEKLGINGVEVGDLIRFLPENKDKYDAIFTRDVLEHFEKNNILSFLEMAREALKSGGSLIIQTVNAENLLWGRLRHGDFTHEVAFTASSIKQVLRVAGFGEVEVYPQRPPIHGFKAAIRHFLWRLFELLMKFYLLVETGSANGIFTPDLIIRAKNEA